MSDMSKPEYLTVDFVESLKWRADDKRRQAEILTAQADQIDKLRREFEGRLRDHNRHKPEATKVSLNEAFACCLRNGSPTRDGKCLTCGASLESLGG